MALAMNLQGLEFFEKVFWANHPVTVQVKALIKNGVKFTTGLYDCTAIFPNFPDNLSKPILKLTCGATSLMKGSVPPDVTQHNKMLLTKWVASLTVPLPNFAATTQVSSVTMASGTSTNENEPLGPQWTAITPPTVMSNEPTAMYAVRLQQIGMGKSIATIKIIRAITHCGLKYAKDKVGAIQGGEPTFVTPKTLSETEAQGWLQQFTDLSDTVLGTVVASPYSELVFTADQKYWATIHESVSSSIYADVISKVQPSKPVNTVMALKEAKALGQKVHGTSHGSVYHTVAIGEHIRLAARIIKEGSVSIRAEWDQKDPTEIGLLLAAGMQVKGSDYASIHLNVGTVSPSRVIGAFILGLGIKWQEAVMSGADLVIG